jgi:cellobiose-specific phosphotransferase system component IIA
MRPIVIAFTVALLAGCGVETAGTAATAGAARKQEVDQAKKTLEQASRRIDDAMAKSQQRLQESDGGK